MLVRGEGESRSMPDRALLSVIVSGEGSSRDGAYQRAATDAAAVDGAIQRRREALERIGTAALLVHPRSRWRKGESVRSGWTATRTTSLEVVDLAVLGDLVAELTAAGADISGPNWQLDPANPARAAARRDAARDARRRADDYATALGLVVESVAWAAEPGLRGADGAAAVRAVPMGLPAPTGAAGAADTIEVAPREITVRAFLEVGFRLAAPPGG